MEDDSPDEVAPPRKVRFLAGVKADEVDTYVRQLLHESERPPSKYELPREYLSVSQVTQYQRCPRQYYFRYIEELISPPGAAMIEGSAMHKALEHALSAKQNSDILPVDTLVDVFRERWKDEDEIVLDEKENEDSILNRSRIFLGQYHADHLPHIEPKSVEMRFMTTLTDGIPVVGYIDLIDGGDEDQIDTVVDHKVTGRMKSEFEVQSDMQLTLYAHVTQLPKVRFDVFLKNKKPKIKTITAVRSSEDIRWTKKVFVEVARAISAGHFPPCDPKNYVCSPKACGYYQRCREALDV